MEVYFYNQVVFDVSYVILCNMVIGLIGVVLYRPGNDLWGVDVGGRYVWGGMEIDGMYDMCCGGCEVPMWVEMDGAMLLKRVMLWAFFMWRRRMSMRI